MTQSFQNFEVIVIDSASVDGTLAVLRNYPVRLYEIDPITFNHGSTRNFGVSVSKGELITMAVQDAKAKDADWIAKLIKPQLRLVINHQTCSDKWLIK